MVVRSSGWIGQKPDEGNWHDILKTLRTLSKFASVTTKRLQAIRKIAQNPKLSKRGITRDNVVALVSERSSRNSLIKDFVDEIASICGKDFRALLDAYQIQYDPDRAIKPDQILAAQSIVLYKRILATADNIQKVEPAFNVSGVMLISADKIIKDYAHVRNCATVIRTLFERSINAKTKELSGYCFQQSLVKIEALGEIGKYSFANVTNYQVLRLVLSIGGIILGDNTGKELFDLLANIRMVLIKYDVHRKKTLPNDDDSSLREEIKKRLPEYLQVISFFQHKL